MKAIHFTILPRPNEDNTFDGLGLLEGENYFFWYTISQDEKLFGSITVKFENEPKDANAFCKQLLKHIGARETSDTILLN